MINTIPSSKNQREVFARDHVIALAMRHEMRGLHEAAARAWDVAQRIDREILRRLAFECAREAA